jgi:hypothetical protein
VSEYVSEYMCDYMYEWVKHLLLITNRVLYPLMHSLTALLLCGTYGNVADKYGRKPTILIPLIGLTVLQCCYLFVVATEPQEFRVVLITGQFIFGLCGSYTVFLMGVMCYVSDATASQPYTRKLAYSITEAVMFTPQVFAPSLVGVWAQVSDYTLPMLMMTCVSAAGIVYVCWMPESLPLNSPSRGVALHYDFFKTLKNLKFIFQYRSSDGSSPLPLLGGAFMLFLVALMGVNAVFIVYIKHRFDWKSGAIGIYEGIKGLLSVVSMLFLTSVYKKVFSAQLRVITWIQVGLFFRVLFYVLVGLMPNSMGILAVSAILLLTGPVIPYTKTVLSNTVPPHSQAQAFSAISAIESLAGLSGPVFDAALVGLLKVNQAWVIFEVAALITLIAFFMIYHIRTSPTLAQNLPQDSKVDESSSSWIGNRSRSRSASRSMSASLAAGGLLCFEAVYENGDSDCESEGLVEENGLQPLLHGSQGDNVT